MNIAIIDGTIGKIERREHAVHVRLCHKDAWYDDKAKEWKQDDTWVTITFFGRKGDAAERTLKVGMPCVMECGVTAWPKEGPGSQMRLNGRSFHLVQRRESNFGKSEADKLPNIMDDEEDY